MLKIRNLIFALSISPVLSVVWQLPNQAQTNPVSNITIIRTNINRSGSTAGTNSGAATGGSQTGIFSSPNTLGNITRVIIITSSDHRHADINVSTVQSNVRSFGG